MNSLQRRIAVLEQGSPGDDLQAELAAARGYYANPLGFVQWAFPWGKGTLANLTGPDDWHGSSWNSSGRKWLPVGSTVCTRLTPSAWQPLPATASGKAL